MTGPASRRQTIAALREKLPNANFIGFRVALHEYAAGASDDYLREDFESMGEGLRPAAFEIRPDERKVVVYVVGDPTRIPPGLMQRATLLWWDLEYLEIELAVVVVDEFGETYHEVPLFEHWWVDVRRQAETKEATP